MADARTIEDDKSVVPGPGFKPHDVGSLPPHRYEPDLALLSAGPSAFGHRPRLVVEDPPLAEAVGPDWKGAPLGKAHTGHDLPFQVESETAPKAPLGSDTRDRFDMGEQSEPPQGTMTRPRRETRHLPGRSRAGPQGGGDLEHTAPPLPWARGSQRSRANTLAKVPGVNRDFGFPAFVCGLSVRWCWRARPGRGRFDFHGLGGRCLLRARSPYATPAERLGNAEGPHRVGPSARAGTNRRGRPPLTAVRSGISLGSPAGLGL